MGQGAEQIKQEAQGGERSRAEQSSRWERSRRGATQPYVAADAEGGARRAPGRRRSGAGRSPARRTRPAPRGVEERGRREAAWTQQLHTTTERGRERPLWRRGARRNATGPQARPSCYASYRQRVRSCSKLLSWAPQPLPVREPITLRGRSYGGLIDT